MLLIDRLTKKKKIALDVGNSNRNDMIFVLETTN